MEAGGDGDLLDVAAIRFPRISNFTDLDALAIEPGVSVRLIDHRSALGDPNLVILPGTKATVADLEWLRGRGFPEALHQARARGTTILGICGGYQMLGRTIDDPVEAGRPDPVAGLDWLPVATFFQASKVTRQRRGHAGGQRVAGYQIHHGRTAGSDDAWITLDDAYGHAGDGAVAADGAVKGTSLHGLFEEDGFRGAFLSEVAERRGKRRRASGVNFAAARESQIDRIADVLEAHIDLGAVEAMLR